MHLRRCALERGAEDAGAVLARALERAEDGAWRPSAGGPQVVHSWAAARGRGRSNMNGTATESTAPRERAWRRYWRIARWHRLVMAALVVGTLVVALSVVLPVDQWVASPQAFFMAAVWTTGLVQALALAGLAHALGLSPFLGVCAVVPYVGLVVMVFLSMRATRRLRAAGFRVGLLGARIPERAPPDWVEPNSQAADPR